MPETHATRQFWKFDHQDQVQNVLFGSELHGFQFFCLILVPCAVLATTVLASVPVYLVAVLVRTLIRYCGIAPPLHISTHIFDFFLQKVPVLTSQNAGSL